MSWKCECEWTNKESHTAIDIIWITQRKVLDFIAAGISKLVCYGIVSLLERTENHAQQWLLHFYISFHLIGDLNYLSTFIQTEPIEAVVW